MSAQRVLLVRLPCNPIFPIGPIYLADHLHKQFPGLPQRILDLAALPLLDVERVLLATVEAFRPTLLVFSWRDIQIYAPVDGRGGNPLQHSFEAFYARNPLRRLRGALGGLGLMRTHYGERWRNLRLVRRGLRRARRFQPEARAVLGGSAAGWNGVLLAEAVRLAAPGRAGDAAGGVLAVAFAGVVVGPSLLGGVVGAAGSYALGFAVLAGLPALGAAIAWNNSRPKTRSNP